MDEYRPEPVECSEYKDKTYQQAFDELAAAARELRQAYWAMLVGWAFAIRATIAKVKGNP